MTLPATLTIPEAASALRVHPSTIRREIDRGRIPVLRVGQQIRLPARWLVELVGEDAVRAILERAAGGDGP